MNDPGRHDIDRMFRPEPTVGIPPNRTFPIGAYVYAYYVMRESVPFYIGFSTGGDHRARDIKNHSSVVRYIWRKHRCRVKIIEDRLSDREAMRLENALIRAFGPILVNKKA